MNGENDGVHPHEKNNKCGENDERDNASEDGTETQHDDAAEPAAVRDASESDSDIDIAAFAAAADGESAHMGSGVPESSGDAAFTDGANKEHIGNADGYSDGHGEYSDGEKDDPSDADGENGRGGKNGKRRPFPLLPVTFITLGVIAVLVVVIYCMQRFDLFESGNADVADTTAATTATVPDTTELPAGSVRMALPVRPAMMRRQSLRAQATRASRYTAAATAIQQTRIRCSSSSPQRISSLMRRMPSS